MPEQSDLPCRSLSIHHGPDDAVLVVQPKMLHQFAAIPRRLKHHCVQVHFDRCF